MAKYQDIYPSPPLLHSGGHASPKARTLLTLEYFEAEPSSMPEEVFSQHHILLNLRDEPQDVEHLCDGELRRFIFNKDEIVVTPAGVKSGWRWHGQSRCIVVTLEPEEFERFAQSELGVLLSHSQLKREPQFQDPDLCQAALLLKESLESQDVGSDVMFESLARVFLIKLVRKYGNVPDETPEFTRNFTSKHYKRVLSFVAENYGQPIAVGDLAKEAGLSSSHFSRLFKQTIGQSPHQFLVTYRLERAVEMMGNLEATLLDIALSCGFADQAHFSRAFKLAYDQTPKHYRATHLGEHAAFRSGR